MAPEQSRFRAPLRSSMAQDITQPSGSDVAILGYGELQLLEDSEDTVDGMATIGEPVGKETRFFGNELESCCISAELLQVRHPTLLFSRIYQNCYWQKSTLLTGLGELDSKESNLFREYHHLNPPPMRPLLQLPRTQVRVFCRLNPMDRI